MGQPGELTPESCPIEAVSRPIKIVVIVPNLDIGGAEMDLVRNLPLLDRRQFAPVVFTLFWKGPLSAQLEEHGIEVLSPEQGMPSNQNIRQWLSQAVERACGALSWLLPPSLLARRIDSVQEYIRLARWIARNLDNAKADVIHAILPGAYLAAAFANILTLRRPLIMSRLSLNWYQREARLFAVIERFFLHRRVEVAIANSQAVVRELRAEGIPQRKLRLIYNGIDAAAFADVLRDTQEARKDLGIVPDAVVFSSVGNLFPYKGHADLLSALSLIKGELPKSWILLVAGKDIGGSLDALRRQADQLGLAQNVRLLGQRRDIPTILSAADIHVSASHHEGFPNNILEAMCARLPVIATAVGGVPEQIIDGETGILVPARDPVALSKALLSLACNPDLRAAMGMRGQDRVQLEFPVALSARALEQTYAAVAARNYIPSGAL